MWMHYSYISFINSWKLLVHFDVYSHVVQSFVCRDWQLEVSGGLSVSLM